MSISEDLNRHERPPQEQRLRKEHIRDMEQRAAQYQDYAQSHVSPELSPPMMHSKPLSQPASVMAPQSALPSIAIPRRDEWFRAGSITPKSASPSDELLEYASGQSSAVKGISKAFGADAPSLKSSTTASFDAQNSGLPPTPPTVENSDEPPREDSLSSNPQFADAVVSASFFDRFVMCFVKSSGLSSVREHEPYDRDIQTPESLRLDVTAVFQCCLLAPLFVHPLSDQFSPLSQ